MAARGGHQVHGDLDDLLPALALALFGGLRGPAQGRSTLFVLPVAWLSGGLLGLVEPAANGNAVVLAVGFLLLGALVAADVPLPRPITIALATIVGLYHGYLNGTGMGSTWDAAAALLGLAAMVFLLVAIAAALVVRLRADWSRIAVRVAGSWIAASGLLLLGWVARRS